MTDEAASLWANYRKALKELGSASGKGATGKEKALGEAYQALVRIGEAPQLRKRYR